MNYEQLKAMNEKLLIVKSLYQHNNELLNDILFNKNCYSNEEIENIEDSIFENNSKILSLKFQLLNHQNILKNQKITNDFLTNNFELELAINKFWYKFYLKRRKDNKIIIKYWKNEYLDCYKKQFFFMKNLQKNSDQLSKFTVNEVNSELQDDPILSSITKVSTLKI